MTGPGPEITPKVGARKKMKEKRKENQHFQLSTQRELAKKKKKKRTTPSITKRALRCMVSEKKIAPKGKVQEGGG